MAQRKKWRIYQFLASMGVVSSKEQAVNLARSGKVTVDGKVVESLHFQVNPIKEVVAVNGKRVELKENRKYFVFHKPAGVLSTKEEIGKFFSVPVDLKNSLYPVGRLDKDTSGLLIVTNDGRLGQKVLNPLTKRKKFYETVVEGNITEGAVEKLKKGVKIRTIIDDKEVDYVTLPADVVLISGGETSKIVVIIIEGKKRQVRLMCKALGYPVISLKRTAIAKLELGDLPVGKYKELDKKEIYALLFE